MLSRAFQSMTDPIEKDAMKSNLPELYVEPSFCLPIVGTRGHNLLFAGTERFSKREVDISFHFRSSSLPKN